MIKQKVYVCNRKSVKKNQSSRIIVKIRTIRIQYIECSNYIAHVAVDISFSIKNCGVDLNKLLLKLNCAEVYYLC